jgi:flavin-binding protein dodecin
VSKSFADAAAATQSVDLVGVSSVSYRDAVKNAVSRASETLPKIASVDVLHRTRVVCDGCPVEYHVDLKVAFTFDRNGRNGSA